jgi:DNA mismatch repair protein MutS
MPNPSILNLSAEQLTPGMRQYQEVKAKHPDCLVMLRMGDFYELFFEKQ